MAEPKYEIDEQGNLVEVGSPAPVEGAEGDERKPVSPEEARRFLRAIALSEVSAVGVAALAAYFAVPDKPVVIVAATVAYAIFSVGVYLYLRRDVYSRVKDPG